MSDKQFRNGVFFSSKPKKSAIEQLQDQSVAAVAIFDKTVKDLELANTSCDVEVETRRIEVEKLNTEISTIEGIKSNNTKLITRINSIFKDED